MFESIINFFKKIGKQEKETVKSKDAAKERLHLVLMQDRANVSADFLDLMKQEIIEVIKKYIDVDENAIDVRLTNKTNGDGTNGAPALYANIPIVSIKEDVKRVAKPNLEQKEEEKRDEQIETESDKKEETNNETEQQEGIKPFENVTQENNPNPNEQKTFENVAQENSTNPSEQKTFGNVAQENNPNPNEQKTFENVAQENNLNPNEQKAFENVVQENSTNPNEQKAFENVAQENSPNSNWQKTYGNMHQENRNQEEQAIQVSTENREQITGNYTRTF